MNRIEFHDRGHSVLLVKQIPDSGDPGQKQGMEEVEKYLVRYLLIAFLQDC